ncbi:hypothetical protein OH77DRAFT_1411003, partial [Trametes cingulata]
MTQTAPAPGENDERANEWNDDNLRAMGNILLRVSPAIRSKISDKGTALEMWDALKGEYDKSGMSATFSHFRAALNVTIPSSSHPGPAIDQIVEHFGKLEKSNVVIPEFIKAMIVVSKLPPTYELASQL